MEIFVEKMIVLVLMFVLMTFCGLLPIKVGPWFTKNPKKSKYYISLVNSFGGGVFFGTYFMFMAPSARETMDEYLLEPNGIFYPIPELAACIGFFMMVYIDKFVMLATKNMDNKQDKTKKKNKAKKSKKVKCSEPAEMLYMGKYKKYEVEEAMHGAVTSPEEDHIPTVSGDVEQGNTALKEKEAEANADMPVHSEFEGKRAYIFLTACSIDCIFGGMSIGLLSGFWAIWTLFIGVIAHEMVVCFTFGLRMFDANFTNKKLAGIIVFYAITTPIGIVIGVGLYEIIGEGAQIEILSACCEALAGGIYVYVTFLEILNTELTHESKMSVTLAVTLGYLFMSAMVMINTLENNDLGSETGTNLTTTVSALKSY